MTRALLAGFPAAEPLLAAARAARDAGRPALDAFTPYPVEGLPEALLAPRSKLPWAMLIGGLGVAAALYALEWWSAVYGYPFDAGARPLNSWPTFVIPPVEFGVLGAAVAGFVSFLVSTGLPRLHHPLFERNAFERASQDQFILALAIPDADAAAAARGAAFAAGAIWVEETQA